MTKRKPDAWKAEADLEDLREAGELCEDLRAEHARRACSDAITELSELREIVRVLKVQREKHQAFRQQVRLALQDHAAALRGVGEEVRAIEVEDIMRDLGLDCGGV